MVKCLNGSDDVGSFYGKYFGANSEFIRVCNIDDLVQLNHLNTPDTPVILQPQGRSNVYNSNSNW